MKNVFYILVLFLSGMQAMEQNIIRLGGKIDDNTIFSLVFNASSKVGEVKFYKLEQFSQSWQDEGLFHIDRVQEIGNKPNCAWLFTISKSKGELFIPKWYNREQATYNGKSINLLREKKFAKILEGKDKTKSNCMIM
jgi:hypothetical protein